MWKFFLAGGMGGVCSRTATAPLDKLKILAQTRTGSEKLSLWSAFNNQVRVNGFRSLFAGNWACCLRVFPFSGIVCIMYGRILSLFPADDKLDWKEPIWRGISAGGAAITATLFTYPLDLVRAKLAVHDASKSGKLPSVRGTL